MKFILPFPPSVNASYGMSGMRRFKGKKTVAWEELASTSIQDQNLKFFSKRCYIFYELCHPDNRVRDAANYEKCTTDLLVSYGIISGDDRRAVKGIFSYWNDKPGKHIIVRIIPVDEYQVPTFE